MPRADSYHETLDLQETITDNSEMFPFDRPTNYGEMLNKIGMFTFLIAFALTLLAANCSIVISNSLSRIQIPVEIWSLHVPVLYVVPALLVATLARIIRLHDK